MQRARFQTFVIELRERCNFPASVTSHGVYHRVISNWFDHEGIPVQDAALASKFDVTLSRSTSWRERNSAETFFPVPELEAVVVITCSSPPRKPTLETIQKALNDSLRHAIYEFDASHDGLTGLLNAKALEAALAQAVSALEHDQIDVGQSITGNTSKQVALLSLDIDHFKQVNDSFGHDYGDVVLFVFANRLNASLQNVCADYPGCSLVLGRAGGEEFNIVLTGQVTEAIARTIADRLRVVIAKVLPSDEEWHALPAERKIKDFELPHVSDRKITSSVGVSSIASSQKPLDVRSLCSTLRREADASLYRAKAGGRNAVRFFPEIRDSHGTVLEHHKATGIVVIDIGMQVGVTKGHEFLVFHPDFSGSKPFVQHDGRSKKTLGHYPRRHSGRIVVFEAQKEISFCTVTEISGPDGFPVGALLELIQVGSIMHLVSDQIGARALETIRLGHADEFASYLKREVTEEHSINVIVFRLLNPSGVEESRGRAFVNMAFAELYYAIDKNYPSPVKISQIVPGMLAVLTEGKALEEQKIIADKVIDEVERRCADIARFGAGLYCPVPIDGDQTAGRFDPYHALDLAKFAADTLEVGSSRLEVFSANTSINLLVNHRREGRHTEGLSDFQRLKECGVTDAMLENQGALCCLEASEPDLPGALALINSAINLQPNFPIFYANRAVIEWSLGYRMQSFDSFEEVMTRDPQFTFPDVYLPTRALATFEKWRTDAASIDVTTVINRLQNALGKPRVFATGITEAEVRKAIDELGHATIA